MLCFAVGVTGCVATSDNATLQYNPQRPVAPAMQARNIPIYIQISDSRPNPYIISHKKNGYGQRTEAIASRENPADIIKNAMTLEFINQGFIIVPTPENSAVQLSVNLIEFYNDYTTKMVGADAISQIKMSLTATSHNGLRTYTKNMTVQAKDSNVVVMGEENAHAILNKALSKGMRELFSDSAFVTALSNVQ